MILHHLYKSLSVENKSIDDYLDAFCGVKIYRDGFRILPFGDKDNDWLELNATRTGSPEFRIATYNTNQEELKSIEHILDRFEKILDAYQEERISKVGRE